MEPVNEAGAQITLQEAMDLTSAYQQQNPDGIKAYLISVDNIMQIIKQDNCVGIRIYNGYDAVSRMITPVIVGVNAEGGDLYEGVIMDKAAPCPQNCDNSSPLSK